MTGLVAGKFVTFAIGTVGALVSSLLAVVVAAPPVAAQPTTPPATSVAAVPAVWLSNCSKRSIRAVRLVANGINIDKTCQRAYFTRRGRVVRNVAVSTGKARYRTRSGHFRVYRSVNKWTESKLYPGAWMYRPVFFSGGQAIHGSAADWLVRRYPDSHGCVRMRHVDVNWMWRNGYAKRGTRVYVFAR
ncbi:MAG: L,D-transpeptidase [Candidatus Nanopelagicales bacterium]